MVFGDRRRQELRRALPFNDKSAMRMVAFCRRLSLELFAPFLSLNMCLDSRSMSWDLSAFVQTAPPRKKRKTRVQGKSGRHIGLQRSCVSFFLRSDSFFAGCFEAFSSSCGTEQSAFFLFRYARAYFLTERWTPALRNRENRRA